MSNSATEPARQARFTGALKDTIPSFDDAKFGFRSIHARYRDRPGRLLRAIDPFSGEFVQFSTPLQQKNWLLRRFDPSVSEPTQSSSTVDFASSAKK